MSTMKPLGRMETEVDLIEAEFTAVSEAFEAQVFALAERKYNELVAPFLAERGMVLFTGNGTWLLVKNGKHVAGGAGDETGVDAINGERRKQDAELVRIVDILCARVEGFKYNDLGSIMPGNATKRNRARGPRRRDPRYVTAYQR